MLFFSLRASEEPEPEETTLILLLSRGWVPPLARRVPASIEGTSCPWGLFHAAEVNTKPGLRSSNDVGKPSQLSFIGSVSRAVFGSL